MTIMRNAYGPVIEFNGLLWVPVHPGVTFGHLGYIPSFLNLANPEPAAKQIDANYRHGGGWTSFKGFKLLEDGSLQYPGDPPTRILYKTALRNETIHFYQHQWLRITQPDGSWEVCRLD